MKNAFDQIRKAANNYRAASITALCMMAAPGITAQNYSKLFDALPDMTLDQSYSSLIEYQKSNPYFSNTYIQLGNVCEKKMILYDPLRETSSIKFWADNAKLFYGNLRVYYSKDDVRSEYYENIKIPFDGKRVTDEDLWRYIDKHIAMCKNYSDTTALIYATIEQSRKNYNECIDVFSEICNEYVNLNDLLLRHDDSLSKKLASLKSHINECEKQFAEYKRLTKLFPIANYRQLYEKKPIETYRLDGLTNSDFFDNRFTIWDYATWTDEVEKVFNEHIKPLRNDVATINSEYAQTREMFERGDILKGDAPAPYDEFFLYKLGHFDVGSLIEPLFSYLESTRKMVLMAGDSIGRDQGVDMSLESRKMRRLSQLVMQQRDAAAKRADLSSAITDIKIAKFKDFFSKEYGGADGLRSFLAKDEAYCQSVVDAMAEATASYLSRVDRLNSNATELYSKATGPTAPVLPLWISLDPQNVKAKYVSTHISRDSRGEIAVAGHAKGNARNWFVAGVSNDMSTKWLTQLKGVNSVCKIASTSEGVLVSAIRQLKPTIIYVNSAGKEALAIPTASEFIDVMERDGVSGAIIWTEGNDNQNPSISLANETSTQAEWTTPLSGFASALLVSPTGDGFVVTGISTEGDLAYAYVSAEGQAGEIVKVHPDVEGFVSSIRISSDEIGVLAKLKNGANKFISFKVK